MKDNPGKTPPTADEEYDSQVPWYRQSEVNSLCLAVGFFACPPFLWLVCIVLITGDVYYETRNPDGSFKIWPRSNKFAAWLVMLLQIVLFVVVFFEQAR